MDVRAITVILTNPARRESGLSWTCNSRCDATKRNYHEDRAEEFAALIGFQQRRKPMLGAGGVNLAGAQGRIDERRQDIDERNRKYRCRGGRLEINPLKARSSQKSRRFASSARPGKVLAEETNET
jgi:hypothetical protein